MEPDADVPGDSTGGDIEKARGSADAPSGSSGHPPARRDTWLGMGRPSDDGYVMRDGRVVMRIQRTPLNNRCWVNGYKSAPRSHPPNLRLRMRFAFVLVTQLGETVRDPENSPRVSLGEGHRHSHIPLCESHDWYVFASPSQTREGSGRHRPEITGGTKPC